MFGITLVGRKTDNKTDLSLRRWISWLSHGEPSHPKHQGLCHPVVACVLYYIIVTTVSFYAHDILVPVPDNPCPATPQTDHSFWAVVFALYSVTLLVWRRTYTPIPVLLYQHCWLCNVTLLQVAGGLYTHRPALAHAYCVTVGIDQLLWYVDLGGFLATRGTFVIGVARYLVWPTNAGWARRCTCTHHLWTIPVALHVLRQQMIPEAYIISAVAMVVNVATSRWLIPGTVLLEGEPTDIVNQAPLKPQHHYLNVNLSWEVWKDIKFRWLQIRTDQPPILYIFQLMWRWQGFNTIVFLLLAAYCRLAFPAASVCEIR